jgi:SAM-dependent methyltransferase
VVQRGVAVPAVRRELLVAAPQLDELRVGIVADEQPEVGETPQSRIVAHVEPPAGRDRQQRGELVRAQRHLVAAQRRDGDRRRRLAVLAAAEEHVPRAAITGHAPVGWSAVRVGIVDLRVVLRIRVVDVRVVRIGVVDVGHVGIVHLGRLHASLLRSGGSTVEGGCALRQAALRARIVGLSEASRTPEEVIAFYDRGLEERRLWQGRARLERERVRAILEARLPPPPATVVDVGGGPGVHAVWLARRGYAVHLIDPVPTHVEQAQAASAGQPDAPLASVTLGEAASLPLEDESADSVLLFGPLYHLPERAGRLVALAEARRVLRPDGLLAAIAISRYTWLLDALASGRLFRRPDRLEAIVRALRTGHVANAERRRGGFTTGYLHRPGELADEVRDAGFALEEVLGVEGPGWLLERFDDAWADEAHRTLLLAVAELVEGERDLVAASTHLLAVARRP